MEDTPSMKPSESTETTLHTLLKDEYMRIHAFTESFDKLAMTVKAWSVTFSLAALVGAFTSHSLTIVLISAVSSIGFWLTETYVRAYQYAYYDRQGKIEAYFRKDKKSIDPLQMGISWSKEFEKIKLRKLLSISLWNEVLLPHVVVFVVAIIIYILGFLGRITI